MSKEDFPARFGGAALVTGASAGIGETFAHALAARGMDLVLVARRKERLDALAEELGRAHGVQTHVVPCDLAERDGPAQIKRSVEERGIDVGLLINNAGFGTYGSFFEQDPDREAEMVDLNCRAPLLLTHAFLPPMLERGRGGMIIVASMAGFQPTPFMATYGATKAFDLMLAEALWAELRPKGVEVLGLCPGFTPTEFQQVVEVKSEGPSSVLTTSPKQVVDSALNAIGKRPSVIPGVANKLLNGSLRFATRSMVAQLSGAIAHPSRMRES